MDLTRFARGLTDDADILLCVTPNFETYARRISVVLTLLAATTGLVALAAPANADVPVGWSDHREPFNMLNAILILGGIPVLIFVAIVLAVYIPPLVRGERVAPGAPALENQWLGGPRQGAAELAGPEAEESEAGGASARW